MKKKSLFVVLLLMGILFTPIVEAFDPEWYDFDWLYRRAHVVAQTANAGTDYSVNITVHYGAGSNTNYDVYLDSKCQTDFDDIRPVASDGVTPLGYWIEEYTASSSATVWIKIPGDLSAASYTYYLYYGNEAATSASKGDEAFTFFDDFPGSSIDTGKWDGDTGGASVSGSILTYTGTGTMQTIADFSDSLIMRSNRSITQPGSNWILHGLGVTDTTNMITALFQSAAINTRIADADTFDTVITDWTSGGYHDTEIIWTSNEVRWFEDGSERSASPYTTTANIPTADIPIIIKTAATTMYADLVLIRKYADPEPSQGAWGEEEDFIWSDQIDVSGFYFENGTKAGAEYATLTLENGTSIEIYLDGNSSTNILNETIVRITWPIEYGADSGTRIIEVQTANESHTLFTPESTFGIYTFEIRDYTARLGMGTAYLEAYRVVNATTYLIEKRSVIAADPYVSMILVIGKVYNLRVRFADNSTYDFGLKTMTEDATISLPILTMSFSQKAQSTYKYITVEATRPTYTKILVNYDDTREATNWANVSVEYLNGTKVVSANYSTDSFSYSWLSAVHNLTYKVRIEFDHGEFGLLPDVVTFLQGNITYSGGVDIGAAGTVGGIATTDILGIVIIAIIIGAGTARNSGAVLLVAALVAAMFSEINFVSFDVVLIEVVIGIVLIYNLVRSSS